MAETDELLQLMLRGDQQALGRFFDLHRDRLRLAVDLRLDPRVKGRIDASDVLQETFVEASSRLEEYCQDHSFPPFLWLRFLALQRVLIMHRRHLNAQARDVRREVAFGCEPRLEVSSEVFAAQLIDSGTSPSLAAARAETCQRLELGLERLEAADREVLALRHFEQLNNAETSAVLGIAPAAASQRYYRALKRLKDVLAELPGEWSVG